VLTTYECSLLSPLLVPLTEWDWNHAKMALPTELEIYMGSYFTFGGKLETDVCAELLSELSLTFSVPPGPP